MIRHETVRIQREGVIDGGLQKQRSRKCDHALVSEPQFPFCCAKCQEISAKSDIGLSPQSDGTPCGHVPTRGKHCAASRGVRSPKGPRHILLESASSSCCGGGLSVVARRFSAAMWGHRNSSAPKRVRGPEGRRILTGQPSHRPSLSALSAPRSFLPGTVVFIPRLRAGRVRQDRSSPAADRLPRGLGRRSTRAPERAATAAAT
jgi:hypothetical protein